MKLKLKPTKVKFNVPSAGVLQKSHPESVFTFTLKDSDTAKSLLSGRESAIKWGGERVKVAVLQVTLVDDTFICEIVEESKL